MPNKKSAIKRVKTDEEKRLRNKATLSRTRTARRQVLEALTSGDKPASVEKLNAYYGELDKAVKKGVMKANTASRYKSRCATKVAALS